MAKRSRLQRGGRLGLRVPRGPRPLPSQAPGSSPRALPLTAAPRPPTQRRVHVTALLGDGAGGAPRSGGRPGTRRQQGWEGNCSRGGGRGCILPPRPSAPRPRGEGARREGGRSCRGPRPAHWRRLGAASSPARGRFPPPSPGPAFPPASLDSLGHTTVPRERAERRIHFSGFWEKTAARVSARGRRGYRGRRSLAGSWRGRGARGRGGAWEVPSLSVPSSPLQGAGKFRILAGAGQVLQGGADLGSLLEEFT